MSHYIQSNKYSAICLHLSGHNYSVVKNDIQENTDELYEILINGQIKDSYDNSICYHYCGIYYEHNNDIVNAKKYYLKATERVMITQCIIMQVY
jgi:hypothetical protein